MLLYHGTYGHHLPDDILTHSGSFSAAVIRAQSLRLARHPIKYDGVNFTLSDIFGFTIGQTTPEQYLIDFAEDIGNTRIFEHEADIKNPLRVNDCWGDDPIASGGMELFKDTDLLEKDRKSLRELFFPFSGIIYPQHISSVYSEHDVKKIRRQYQGNSLFRRELEKRIRRSRLLGEPLDQALPQEIVWVYLTIKLRNWALERGFDSFSYRSPSEGGGDCYATFCKGQSGRVTSIYRLDKRYYIESVLPAFESRLVGYAEAKRTNPQAFGSDIPTEIFWGYDGVKKFWNLQPAG